MTLCRLTTSTGSITRWYTEARYRGERVMLASAEFISCPHRDVVPVHHFDERGRHYCPTGFIACRACDATGHEPDPPACTRWEEPWWSRMLRVSQTWGLAGLLRKEAR